MKPDLDFAADAFRRYNKEIFGGKLPEPAFRLTHARTFQGKMTYKWRRILMKRECYDFEMRLSLDFDLPREEWEDVVIHEMIHLHIAFEGLRDSSSHGPVFRKLMQGINRGHGRHITVSGKADPEQREPDMRVRGHYLCLARMSDGRLGVAPVVKTRMFDLWDGIWRVPGVVAVRWVGTTDPWFNRFPRVMKPKLWLSTREEVAPHLKGAVEFVREGNVVRGVSRRCSPDELLP